VSVASALEPHPLAELIPGMSEAEYAELRDDIAANGQQQKIALFEGKVLDGRHRARACEELGIEPATYEYTGGDPVRFVVSLNLKRRHLTVGQRAMCATALLAYEKERAKQRQQQGGLQKVPQNSGEPRHHREAAAAAGEKFNTSRDSVEKARALKEARPDLAEKVQSGEMTLNAAIEAHRGRATNGRDFDKGVPTTAGITGRTTAAVYFGKGDKWKESTEPLSRYLKAWEKRGFDFGHVKYYCADGQQRLRGVLASAKPPAKVPAVVFIVPEFRKALSPLEKHVGKTVAKEAAALAVERAVEATGFSIAASDSTRAIGAPVSLYYAYNALGEQGLVQLLMIVSEAWPDDRKGVSAAIIRALTDVIEERNSNGGFSRTDVTKKLAETTPGKLLRKAEDIHFTRGKAKGAALRAAFKELVKL
jgi:hypothetical protein